MTTHEIEVDDVIWERWTASIPDGTSVDRRISELLLADIEGRIGEADSPARGRRSPSYPCPMCEESFPQIEQRDQHLSEAHDLVPL